MAKWEVFDPKNGTPIIRTRYELFAKLICALFRSLDYEKGVPDYFDDVCVDEG